MVVARVGRNANGNAQHRRISSHSAQHSHIPYSNVYIEATVCRAWLRLASKINAGLPRGFIIIVHNKILNLLRHCMRGPCGPFLARTGVGIDYADKVWC